MHLHGSSDLKDLIVGCGQGYPVSRGTSNTTWVIPGGMTTYGKLGYARWGEKDENWLQTP